MQLMAFVEEGKNGWLVGRIKEIPTVISQGKTIEKLKINLLDVYIFN